MTSFPHLILLRLGTFCYISDRNILTSPSGLESLNTLRYLNLNYNNIKDISCLDKLKGLTHLAIEFNKVEEISTLFPFSGLSHWFLCTAYSI